MSPAAVKSETREIQLTQGVVAIVDAADFERLVAFKWHVTPRSRKVQAQYARRRDPLTGKHIWMHREVIGAPVGVVVDHINRNSLDNRRQNLRLCTARENGINRTSSGRAGHGFRGVKRVNEPGHSVRYAAMITSRGKRLERGYFKTPREAALHYDKLAIELHGEFAVLNFPEWVAV